MTGHDEACWRCDDLSPDDWTDVPPLCEDCRAGPHEEAGYEPESEPAAPPAETDDPAGPAPSETDEPVDDDAPPVDHEGGYFALDWSNVQRGVFPPEMVETDSWLLTDPESKAPYKAGGGGEGGTEWSKLDSFMAFEEVSEIVEMEPAINRAYILQREEEEFNYTGESDDLLFVDYDDVVDEETGEPHPAAVEQMQRLGMTYTDFSTSGTGNHQLFEGELPEHVQKFTFQLPDDAGEVEIYDRNRNCVATGKHLAETPETLEPVNDEELDRLLEAFTIGKEPPQRAHDPEARDAFDASTYEAEATSADETTADIRDIYAALDRIDAQDVAARTIVSSWNDSASTSDGERAFAPVWGPNANGTANIVNSKRWQDTGGSGYGGVAVMASIDLGDTSYHSADPNYLRGAEWWRAVDHLREMGFPIPHFESDPSERFDHLGTLTHRVTLPQFGQERAATRWRDDRGEESDGLQQQAVYDRTGRTIGGIMDSHENAVCDGIMGSGKTYSGLKEAHEREEAVAYLARRFDLYEQARDYAAEVGYDDDEVYVLPSFHRDCPSATGAHSEHVEAAVHNLYQLGVPPAAIHKLMDLPCEADDAECPYRAQLAIDTDDYDLLIGHHKHAHLPHVVAGRHVLMDEDPSGSFETTLAGEGLIRAVNTFLGFADSPPGFDSFNDIIAHREDPERVEQALAWFETYDWEEDYNMVHQQADAGLHAKAPHAVYAMLAGERIGDSTWHRSPIPEDNGLGIYHESDAAARSVHEVTFVSPPNESLPYAKSVIGLDGTPVTAPRGSHAEKVHGRTPMWELALGLRLKHRRVLTNPERIEFLQSTQGLNFIRSSPHIKPYSSGKWTNWGKDAALLDGARQHHDGQRPVAITTKAARQKYEREADADDIVRAWDHYGAVRGTNRYASERLGVLLGSPHHGDHHLQRRAAMLGIEVNPDGKGTSRRYGSDIADALLADMRESTVGQAALRFGRDGKGATVYLHTAAVPEWLPVAAEGRVTSTWTETQQAVMNALDSLDAPSTREVTDAIDIDRSRRQVYNVLSGLAGQGYLARDTCPNDGRTSRWRDEGLCDAPTYGTTDLPEVDESMSDDAAIEETLRTTTYTRDFLNSTFEVSHYAYDIADRPRDGGGPDDEDPPPDDSE